MQYPIIKIGYKVFLIETSKFNFKNQESPFAIDPSRADYKMYKFPFN